MYTLDDIDLLFPEDLWGSLYRDLYHEEYGEWPRDIVWQTPEDFLEEFDRILEDDWSKSTAVEDKEDEPEVDWLSLDDEYNWDRIEESLGYDKRMNRDDEWD